MKLFSLALLVGGASTAFGYSIDESCNTCGATQRIKAAVEEAKAVLKYAAQVSTACAALNNGDGDCPDNRLRDITRNLLGDIDSDTYTKIKNSFEPAWRKIGDFSETLDTVDIGCGDSSLVRVDKKGTWRDQKRKYANASPPGGDAQGVTPCDLVSALTYDTNPYNKGNTVMLCDKRADSPLRQQDTFSQVNKGNIHTKPVDFVQSAWSLSGTLVHEFMHVSDTKKFPGIIGNQPEVYKYDACHDLRNSDARWHNADTFAILARVWYLNNYEAPDSNFKVLPKSKRPAADAVNGPPEA